MADISSNSSQSDSESSNSESSIEIKKKIVKPPKGDKVLPKEAWKPDQEPPAKPKRKYVRKAQTEKEAMEIKEKRLANLAKARLAKQKKVSKPVEKEKEPKKEEKKKVVKQYITNNYITEPEKKQIVQTKPEKILIPKPKFNFV